jgi:hypothetical protein
MDIGQFFYCELVTSRLAGSSSLSNACFDTIKIAWLSRIERSQNQERKDYTRSNLKRFLHSQKYNTQGIAIQGPRIRF